MRYIVAAAVVALAGCRSVPPSAPAPQVATEVNASFGRAWDAVIDVFAERNLSIATVDRSSGLIVPAEAMYAPRDTSALQYADCGKTMGVPIPPSKARFNVVVRGDSARSSVLVRAFYTRTSMEGTRYASVVECSSRGTWEDAVEANIKERAESPRVAQ